MKDRIRNILMEATVFEDRPNINDNFWKWFGKSKVVDEYGNPLVVYHGTGKEFIGNSFIPSKWFGDIYFASELEVVHKYGKSHIIPVYLRIENDGFERYKEIIENRLSDGREEANDMLKAEGYDGWIEPYQLVVFDPIQVKSIYNDGTWNPNSPDIMK